MALSKALNFGCLESALAKNQTQEIINQIQGLGTKATCQLSLSRSPLGEDDNTEEVFLATSDEETDHLVRLLQNEQIRLIVLEASDVKRPLPADLDVLCVPQRKTPYEAFLNRQGQIMDELEPDSTVGVLSSRTQAQMSDLWPDVNFPLLTGGVDRAMTTHMRHSEIDGLVLPASVTELLGIQTIVAEIFSPDFMLPGPGQGMLLVIGRKDDTAAKEHLQKIHCKNTYHEWQAEQAFMHAIGVEEDLNPGAMAKVMDDNILLVASTGPGIKRISVSGKLDEAQQVGKGLASQILDSFDAFADLIAANFPGGVSLDEDARSTVILDENLDKELDNLDEFSHPDPLDAATSLDDLDDEEDFLI